MENDRLFCYLGRAGWGGHSGAYYSTPRREIYGLSGHGLTYSDWLGAPPSSSSISDLTFFLCGVWYWPVFDLCGLVRKSQWAVNMCTRGISCMMFPVDEYRAWASEDASNRLRRSRNDYRHGPQTFAHKPRSSNLAPSKICF